MNSTKLNRAIAFNFFLAEIYPWKRTRRDHHSRSMSFFAKECRVSKRTVSPSTHQLQWILFQHGRTLSRPRKVLKPWWYWTSFKPTRQSGDWNIRLLFVSIHGSLVKGKRFIRYMKSTQEFFDSHLKEGYLHGINWLAERWEMGMH